MSNGDRGRWRLSELVQVPVVPEAATTFVPRGLIRLAGGDWACHGMNGEKDVSDPYKIRISSLPWVRAPALTGPWRRVSEIAFDDLPLHPTTGQGCLQTSVQLRSDRIIVPMSVLPEDVNELSKWDVCIAYSDDEGRTWHHSDTLRRQLEAPSAVWSGFTSPTQLPDGSLLWPLAYYREGTDMKALSWAGASQGYVRSFDEGETWDDLTFTFVQYGNLAFREAGVRVLANGEWLACARCEDHGIVGDRNLGPFGMPTYVMSRSKDGKVWSEPRLCVNGVELAMEILPGGAVLLAWRDNNYAALRLSYDHGYTWGPYHDPFEVPWKRRAAVVHGQWPPGGSPRIQVLDDTTAVAAYETGIAPSGAAIDPPPKESEFQGWIAVRYLRRATMSD